MSFTWSSHTFERNGVKLVYHEKGAGAPMLLLHGITDSGKCWGRVADALAQEYTVYALDQRGHGASDAPPSGYTYADYIADAVELLRVNGHANAVVMGHSFGGMVGLAMAAQSATVAKLILVDPPLRDADPTMTAGMADTARYEWFEWLRSMQKLSQPTLVSLGSTQSPHWSDDELDAWAESKLQASPRLWQANGVPMSGDWRALLDKVGCPTLLVYGDPERGGLVDAVKANQVVAQLKYGEAAFVVNAGHSIHRDEHDAFMAEIIAFLQVT